MIHSIKRRGLALAGLVALTFLPCADVLASGTAASGSQIAPQPCDPAYWNTMKSRAWMEAEREIIQNQNLIFKPDSVLEYVCFDKFADHSAEHAGSIFVHTSYFGKEILKKTDDSVSMQGALSKVVGASLKSYQDGSFNVGRYLSSRAHDIKNKGDETALNKNLNAYNGRVQYGSYSCDVMKEVWKTAKCINFIDNDGFLKTGDGFYPFKKLEPVQGAKGEAVKGYQDSFSGDNDPRQWPYTLRCKGPEAQGTASTETKAPNGWGAEIDQSINKKDVLYPYETPLAETFQKVRERIEPGGAKSGSSSTTGTGGGCAQAIETGITVLTTADPNGYKDGVCTNPGCTYTKGSTSTVGKCQ